MAASRFPWSNGFCSTTLPHYSRQRSEVLACLPQTPWHFDDQTRRERRSNANRLQVDSCNNNAGSAASHGARMLEVKARSPQSRRQQLRYFLEPPFWDEDTTQGSDAVRFSAAHCRANRLSSAAVNKLSLCLIFSHWGSLVLPVRWTCPAI